MLEEAQDKLQKAHGWQARHMLKGKVGDFPREIGVNYESSKMSIWAITKNHIVIKIPGRSVWNDRWSTRHIRTSFVIYNRISDFDTEIHWAIENPMGATEFGTTKPIYDDV